MKKRPSTSSSRRSSISISDEREKQRQQYIKQIESTLDDEEDPLAVYHQFVQWTVKNYSKEDPSSGLLELLEEVTRRFKADPLYKADLRYLKLWTLYAKHVEHHSALSIYKFLMTSEIGVSYSLLYEEYANALESEGRKQDADTIYRRGIKRQVRPLERLKTKYKEFQARVGSPSSSGATSGSPSGNSTEDVSKKNPIKNHTSDTTPRSSKARSGAHADLTSTSSTAASRYALMLAPPPPGKRPEKQRFNFSLLFSDGMEYSIQEARARSMGLLGKKWGPPPVSETRYSTTSAQVDFNDDGAKSTMGHRKSLMGGAEPTVTINTKEALADVFGMYNSPDKTNIFPGSKHAPVKKIEPVTPIVPLRLTSIRESENAVQNAKTPTTTFRPFVDENSQSNRVTPAAKFTPFVDPDARKTPLVTPRPALAAKDATPILAQNENAPRPRPGSKPGVEEKLPGTVFSKVFAPVNPKVAHHDAFIEEHQEHQSDLLPRSQASEGGLGAGTFTPIVDDSAKTPFKVFSKPPESDNGLHAQNAFTPKMSNASFAPFVDKTPTFTPFRDPQSTPIPLADKTPALTPRTRSPQSANGFNLDEEERDEEYEQLAEHLPDEDQGEGLVQYEAPLTAEESSQDYEEEQPYREPPLGGRFGQFNVMTPITERTCEFTTSTRGGITPRDHYYETAEEGGSPRSNVFLPSQIGEREAIDAAERLAAELREHDGEKYRESDRAVALLEERTASLSLAEKLSLNQSFQPPNPCNPFDPPILSSLLSRITSDAQFFNLRDQQSNRLEVLEKFAKKSRKTSASSGDSPSSFTLDLHGHRFMVSEKLGEGGFGSVFQAHDLGKRAAADEDEEDSDDFDLDLDEENVSMVAIKVVKPRNTWEYHVLRRMHSALPPSLRRSLVLPHALYAYSDESFLVLDLCAQGMLLTIVNNAVSAGVSQQGACLDELLVMFFSIELMRLVEGLHGAGFIHGDLKIDNCLLRLEDIPGGASAWSATYQPSGEGGWSYKGLKVIDFGRTVDTRLFPVGQQFVAEWKTDERDCFELREQRPWTYQTDYFGLAGIIYCMLFGKYIQESSVVLVPNSSDRYKIGTPLKRYWQGDIWNRLFDVLLNPCFVKPNGALPICDELASIRKDMENWLQANCNRSSNTLKGLLKKVEKSCYSTL